MHSLIRASGFCLLWLVISSCNCENRVAVQEVDACYDVMDGLGYPQNEQACDQCCMSEGYDMGSPSGAMQEAVNQFCDCGNLGTCDEEGDG